MPKNRVFNRQNRRVLRKRFPFFEILSSLLLVLGLGGSILWFFAQANHYDPGERDINLDQLLQGADDTILYNQPLKRWQEPGTKASPSAPVIVPFPPSVLDSQWQASSSVKHFDSKNLYVKINGEAEKFLKQDFQALHYLVLKMVGGESEISIELYDQDNLQGSMGIFADHLSEDKVTEEQGTVIYFKTSVGAIGRKGRFFFRLAGNEVSPAIVQKSQQLVQAFGELQEQSDELPLAFSIFRDSLKIPTRYIDFQKANVFQFDFASKFWFAQIDPSAPARFFIHHESNEEALQSLFDLLLDEQSYDYEIKEERQAQVVLFHNFLKNYFVMRRHGEFLIGIENLNDPQQIPTLLQRFSEAIQNG